MLVPIENQTLSISSSMSDLASNFHFYNSPNPNTPHVITHTPIHKTPEINFLVSEKTAANLLEGVVARNVA